MSRGRVSVIRDPAIAVAAAKCWMARWQGGRAAKKMLSIPTNSFHPGDCGFCDYPTDRLIEAVTEFRTWAGLEPPKFVAETTEIRESVEKFLMLPSHEQHRLVQKAQGYLADEDEDEHH